MALSGSLHDFDLSYIVQIISQEGKTGKLVLRTDGKQGCIVFTQGKITYADDGDMQLSDMILRYVAEIKRYPKDKLRQLDKSGGAQPARLAAEVLKRNLCEPEELETLCLTGLEDLACALFLWDDGNYHFDVLPSVDSFRIQNLACSADAIMMEAARRADEWQRMTEALKGATVFIRADQAPNESRSYNPLDNAVEYVYARIDGASSIAYLCENSFLAKYRIHEALYELIQTGRITALSPKLSRSINAALQRSTTRHGDGLTETILASVAATVFVFAVAGLGLGLIQGVLLGDQREAAQEQQNRIDRIQAEQKVAIASLRYHAWGRAPLADVRELITFGYLSPRDIPR